jgi:hypothetical protein
MTNNYTMKMTEWGEKTIELAFKESFSGAKAGFELKSLLILHEFDDWISQAQD